MSVEVDVCPPAGQTSFSGIPESQFIDDVDSYMKVQALNFDLAIIMPIFGGVGSI